MIFQTGIPLGTDFEVVTSLPLGLMQTESALTGVFSREEKNIFLVKRFSY